MHKCKTDKCIYHYNYDEYIKVQHFVVLTP